MKLISPVLADGAIMPIEFTGDGADVSPPLQWSEIPKGTRSITLICEDPDAPQAEPWVHWLIYDISASASSIPKAVPRLARLRKPLVASQGLNSFGHIGYNGPLPPYGHGWHRYFFRAYALNTETGLRPGVAKYLWLAAIEGHVLARADLMVRYQREAVRRTAA